MKKKYSKPAITGECSALEQITALTDKVRRLEDNLQRLFNWRCKHCDYWSPIGSACYRCGRQRPIFDGFFNWIKNLNSATKKLKQPTEPEKFDGEFESQPAPDDPCKTCETWVRRGYEACKTCDHAPANGDTGTVVKFPCSICEEYANNGVMACAGCTEADEEVGQSD